MSLRHHLRILVLAGTALLAFTSRAEDLTPTATPIDLNGVWNLDEKASDDLKPFTEKIEKLLSAAREARQSAREGAGGGDDELIGSGNGSGRGGMSRPGGGMGGRGGGMGGRGGGMGEPGGRHAGGQGESPRGGGDPVSNLTKAVTQLLISGDHDRIEIMDGNDQTRAYIADGELHSLRQGRGPGVAARTVWQDGVLVIEQTGGPLTTVRRLHLTPDGKRLLVEMTVRGDGEDSASAHLEYVSIE